MCRQSLQVYSHPVKYAFNTSVARNYSEYQNYFTEYNKLLITDLKVHKQCLDSLMPFLCRSTFITCDPAFNASVRQNICRRACETLTFMCPEVMTMVLHNITDFPGLDFLRCDGLVDANGGDAPDCIDPLDGGNDICVTLVLLNTIHLDQVRPSCKF